MLYFLLVKIFSSDLGDRKLLYIAIGWGIVKDTMCHLYSNLYSYISLGVPVPIVAISAGVAHDHYGHDDL